MTLSMPFLPAFPQPSGRLAVGLALSMLAHLLLIASFRPATTAYVPAQPLQVAIQRVSAHVDTPFAITSESGAQAAVSSTPAPVELKRFEPSVSSMSAVPNSGFDLPYTPDSYFGSREVEVRAEPLNDVTLVYPQFAYQQRIRGKVILRLLINERGGLDHVSVLGSEPSGMMFEEAALTATRTLQFSPAKKNGRNVKSRKDIEVAFDPYETIHIP